MKNPFHRANVKIFIHRAVRRSRFTRSDSRDLSDEELNHISGGVSYFRRHEGRADDYIGHEMSALATRFSDNAVPWLWKC